jgi:glutamyl-tRNA synthetase
MALFNRVFANKTGGKFVLRIEDTDRVRSRADSEQAIFDALRWTGLTWDEGPDIGGPYGPYRQSERSEIYRENAQTLIDNRRAYRCFCTAERLAELRETLRKAKAKHQGYDGACREIDPAESEQRAARGESHTVRLVVPRDGTLTFRDRLRGDVEIDASQIDDQILMKSDGFPTYHLANVVDDHLMEITHVIRAEEWISSTPKHVLLYQAFGWEQPEWIHMPLLRNADKSKISKRKNPVSINYYRDIGILPHALVNFLGIMGWSLGGDREKFSLEEMTEVFSWDRVSLGGPVFNIDKLRWMNELYIHELDYEQLTDALLDWRLGREMLLKVVPLVRERIKELSDFVPATDFFFCGDLSYEGIADQLVLPDVDNKQLKKQLLALVDSFDTLESFDAQSLEQASRSFCEERGWKTKHLFMLLRYGVTARKASPPLFETMAVLGKELTRRRLRELAQFIGSRK